MPASTWDFIKTQYANLPIVPTPDTINGGVYIVTGGNHGIGLECVKHLVRLSASRVIFTCRDVTRGRAGLAEIEADTGVEGVAEVWELDLGDFNSIKAFAKKVDQLGRLDAIIESASLALEYWTVSEGMETSIAVNIVGTFLLALLVFPKLQESGKKFGITPHLTIIGSTVGFEAVGFLEGIDGNILDALNREGRFDMMAGGGRYAQTKLLQLYIVRELAGLLPCEKTGVIININCPGLCNTGLARHTSYLTRLQIRTMNALVGRTPEMGSRTYLYAVSAGPESHGKFCQSCAVRESWVADWVTNESGQEIQRRLWNELSQKLEKIEPGCVNRVIDSSH